MIAAKVLRIASIHGRCFCTCYVLKLLSTIAHSRRTRARARTKNAHARARVFDKYLRCGTIAKFIVAKKTAVYSLVEFQQS